MPSIRKGPSEGRTLCADGYYRKKRDQLDRAWRNMRARCNNSNNERYVHYGGRGITVCPEWSKLKVFREWAINNGFKPGLTIDRIDTDKGYNPKNCQWVPKSENHDEMMRRNLYKKTGIFSKATQEKSKSSNRRNNGKPTYCERDGKVLSFGSRGELVEFLATDLGRKKENVKSHVNLCLRGLSQSIGGYKVYADAYVD